MSVKSVSPLFLFFLHLILSCMSREKYHATSNSLTNFVKHHKQPLLRKHHKRPLSTRFLYILKQDNNFGTIQEYGQTEKSCRNQSFVVFPQKQLFVVFPKSGRLWCFPKGNKGLFKTTGDRGRIFFGGIMDTLRLP